MGIHHITAIASNPRQTVDFYTRILGLRLVKKTVNQDDTEAYHLFFGDKTGEPGMDLTFFTFQPAVQGQRGVGQVTCISLAVPEASLSFWQQRFETHKIKHEKQHIVFNTHRIVFYDHDNQKLELVGVPEKDLDITSQNIWTTPEITKKEAIRYFYSARLTVSKLMQIEPILTNILSYQPTIHENTLYQYQIPEVARAGFIEVEESPSLPRGLNATGTVHHIAFQVADDEKELQLRQKLMQSGLYPTDVIDRFYFKSVYFRTPAGILFELATNKPGFTADEEESKLGEKLSLPPFLESQREEIEAHLEKI